MPHFLEILGARYRGGHGSGNDASLAEIRAQKEGRPDWRWLCRDFPMISRKSMTDLWELIAPYFWALIADRGILKSLKDVKRFCVAYLKDLTKYLKCCKDKILCDSEIF